MLTSNRIKLDFNDWLVDAQRTTFEGISFTSTMKQAISCNINGHRGI